MSGKPELYYQQAQIALLRKINRTVTVGRIGNPTYALAKMAVISAICKRKKAAVYARVQYMNFIRPQGHFDDSVQPFVSSRPWAGWEADYTCASKESDLRGMINFNERGRIENSAVCVCPCGSPSICRKNESVDSSRSV